VIGIQEVVRELRVVDVVAKKCDHLLEVVHADVASDFEPRVDDRLAEADSAAEVQ
jgi:hypothetical protein